MSALAALNAPRVRAMIAARHRAERWQYIPLAAFAALFTFTLFVIQPAADTALFFVAIAVFLWVPAAALASMVDGLEALAKVRNAVALGASSRDVTWLAVRLGLFAGVACVLVTLAGWWAAHAVPHMWNVPSVTALAENGGITITASPSAGGTGQWIAPAWTYPVVAVYGVCACVAGYTAGFAQFMVLRRALSLPPAARYLAATASFVGLAVLGALALFPVTLWLCHREAKRYRQDLCLRDRG